jgi:hypothetical protein
VKQKRRCCRRLIILLADNDINDVEDVNDIDNTNDAKANDNRSKKKKDHISTLI